MNRTRIMGEMHMWKRIVSLAHRAGFTASEAAVLLFLSAAILAGTVLHAVTPDGIAAVPNWREAYRIHDSVFAARSALVMDAASSAARTSDQVSGGDIPIGEGAARAPVVINLNTATEQELTALPGVGPSIAREILSYRKVHGRFTSIDEVLEVKYIGEKKFERMRPYIKVAD